MKKIPTLFVRDPKTGLRYVTPEVHPDCQWVLDGAGIPTRKYDGTCVMFDGSVWWARREVKPGKATPPEFVQVEHDEVTGKTVGWEPIEQSAFAKYHAEAAVFGNSTGITGWPRGTYELVGPKGNGNPERTRTHALWAHDAADALDDQKPRSYASIRHAVIAYHDVDGAEGIVYHHPDGRMAMIKRKDFPRDPEAVS